MSRVDIPNLWHRILREIKTCIVIIVWGPAYGQMPFASSNRLGQNYAQESAPLLNRSKLIQATITDKLDCRTTTGVTRALRGFLDLLLHEARGIYMEDISRFRMSSLIDFVAPFAI
jgi:hypothetical protein